MNLHRIFLLAMLMPGAAAGQSGPYRLPAGDTIRYHEVTNGETRIRTPQGDIASSTEHDARIGLVGSAPGSARAWFETLRLRALGPNGDQQPATTELLSRPYELAFSPRGQVEVRGTPEFPASIAAITDLTHQFFDFFAVMPEGQPRPGMVWQDTIRTVSGVAPDSTQLNESIRRFEVRGDTTAYGVSATVIDVTARLRMEGTMPLPGQPLTVTTMLTGEDSGMILFDWSRGRMLYRSRNGEMAGTFRITGGPMPAEFPQTATYSSTIEVVQ